MAIIALNSPKGGVSKTTTAILLATELALHHGYRVALADADVNQHSVAFAKKAAIPGFTVFPDVTDANVLAVLRQASEEADVVFVDLPGATSTLNLKSLQRADYVILPCQPSLPDVRDAFKGIRQIDEAEELKGVPIARAILWTRVLSGFESRPAREVRQTVESRGLPLFASSLMERSAFREIHITGQVPRQVDARGTAAANVAAIAAELLDQLAKLRAAA